MIIKSLELFNIRSHANSVINFDNGITVLSGRTGSGKSSFFMGIAYALFGADASFNNDLILRRGAINGFVRLSFINDGRDYEVMRGVKRSGSRLIADPDNLWVKENGRLLPLIARSAEVNEKILELLKYPSDVKAKDLFEVTCYAKQDDIRKLIELSPAERERYIDKVLQLSKYELTYQNLKVLTNSLDKEASSLNARLNVLEVINESILVKGAEINQLKDSLVKVSDELLLSDSLIDELSVKKSNAKLILDSLNSKRHDFERKRALLDNVNSEVSKLVSEREVIDSEIKALCVKLSVDELINRQSILTGERSAINEKINSLNSGLDEFSNLKGKCSVCYQEVSNEYAGRVVNDFNSRLNELKGKLLVIDDELINVRASLISARKFKQLSERFDFLNSRINELSVNAKSLSDDVANLSPVLDELSYAVNDFDLINDEFLKASKFNSSLVERKKYLSSTLDSLSAELIKLNSEIKSLSSDRERFSFINSRLKLLIRLRDDIRDIRGVVRSRFLEDFRCEFQRKFEELRQDDSFTVDVASDYSPIACHGVDEVSINSLSGGERTSVALAYRLALSSIASRVSSVDHNEVLLLDEPTTGFDKRDVSALPSALRAIKLIPQIIIVSHDDELKEAADIKYELVKINGVSKVLTSGLA